MEKTIVVPGEKLDKNVTGDVFIEKDNAFSMVLGLLEKRDPASPARLISLNGKYVPNRDDQVIGIVADVRHGGVSLEINLPYSAFLQTDYEYGYQDVILARVQDVTETRSVLLDQDRKLVGGELIEISPTKVSRVIGKNNSMISMISEKTKSTIYVGRNGRIWLKSGDIAKAEQAIYKIEKEAHTTGLTERIKAFLETPAA